MKVKKYIDFEYIQDGLEKNVMREANKAFIFILHTFYSQKVGRMTGVENLLFRVILRN